MWNYQKMLQYPINIKNPDPAAAKIILTQFGGPDGELGASVRYLSQRYTMPYSEAIGVLTDIGTEECVPWRYICCFQSKFCVFCRYSPPIVGKNNFLWAVKRKHLLTAHKTSVFSRL